MTAAASKTTARGKRLGWAGYASIIRTTQVRPTTAQRVATRFGVQLQTARRVMARLHDLGMVHVSGWERPHARGSSIPLWAFGAGQDQPRPEPPSGRPRQGLTRQTALPELVQVAHILRQLQGEPMGVAELAAAVGSQYANVARLLHHGRSIGLFRVAAWSPRLKGGAPGAMWAMGSAADAPRPSVMTRSEIDRRSRQARQARQAQQRMLMAVAGLSGDGDQAANEQQPRQRQEAA